MERVTEFENLLISFKEDYVKFMDKGNKAAATRARKTLQEVRNMAKDLRDEISNTKKDMAKV